MSNIFHISDWNHLWSWTFASNFSVKKKVQMDLRCWFFIFLQKDNQQYLIYFVILWGSNLWPSDLVSKILFITSPRNNYSSQHANNKNDNISDCSNTWKQFVRKLMSRRDFLLSFSIFGFENEGRYWQTFSKFSLF